MLLDLLFVLATVLPLTIIFAAVFRRYPLGIVLWYFVLLLLATWAGGVWIPRVISPALGTSWLPFLVAGLFSGLLLAALVPRSSPHGLGDSRPKKAAPGIPLTYAVFTALFWILVILLVAAVTAWYL